MTELLADSQITRSLPCRRVPGDGLTTIPTSRPSAFSQPASLAKPDIDDGFFIPAFPLKTKVEAHLVSRIRIAATLCWPQVEVALPRQLFENRIFTNAGGRAARVSSWDSL
jgi:hypothetical protein